jgi:hypothetical protein
MLPLDTSCQAEYEDGFILDETELNDVSPYDPKFNVIRAILEKTPEKDHGKMVRFSVFWKDKQYNVNWVGLPDNARPIRFRKKHNSFNETYRTDTGEVLTSSEPMEFTDGVDFGYQYTDENGQNVQEIQEIR